MSERPDKVKSLLKGADNNPVQITTKFKCRDEYSDFSSPYAYTTAIVGMTVPLEAYEFIVCPNTLLHISDVGNMADYDEIAADSKEAFPCADLDKIFIRGGTAGGTLTFRYHHL
jgi:hypothetical protein|tara:strand:- start:387 stop:728 length:342 start_codon:yes stop_codon:yes gene_type:complete